MPQVRGLFSVGLNGQYSEAVGAGTSILLMQLIVSPEMFPGPGAVYDAVVSWRCASSQTYTVEIYEDGTLQDVSTNPAPDGSLVASDSVTGTGLLTLTLTGLAKPTSVSLWKLAMDGGGAAITGLRATLK